MASSADTPFGVVTQVYPQQSGPAASASCTTQHVSPVLQKFLNGEPKALGTVQIMIGVLDILFGIALSFYADNISVPSGIFFWGGLIYISSGALSVAASNKLNHCLVRGALVMNIISTITAGIAIILFSLDFIFHTLRYSCHDREDSDYSCRRMQYTLEARSYGISGVLLVFTVLEFIISICVSAFACEAACASSPVQVVYMAPANSQVASPNPLISAPDTKMPPAPILGQDVIGSAQTVTPACNMASSADTPFGVVTQVYPQQSGPAASASCTTQHVSPVLQKFLKGEPKALGTVQIMIGVLDILFGIVMAFYVESIGVYSLIVFWGGLIYILSGALSVAASNKLSHCLVRGALGMNITSTITAGIAIILFSLDFGFKMMHHWCYDSEESSYYYEICKMIKPTLEARSYGISGVLLVFSVLEFIVSICVSAFACKAVCDSSPGQVVYMAPANSQVASPNPLISAPNTYEMPPAPILGQDVIGSTQTEKPPQYDELLP